MTRAAIYLRQSSDPGDTRLAITRQREDCTALCTTRGWDIIATYTDNDRSASGSKPRPEYQQMLNDIRAGLIDAVVVWDLDRLHRKPIELEEFITLADERQLSLATVGGDTDLSTDGGRLFARIKGAVAKAEVERKAARQKRANQQRRAAGEWLRTGTRPFGYDRDGQPVEHEADLIRQAAADVLAGTSLRSIAIGWSRRGLTTTKGGKWTNLALRRVLANPLYAGLVRHNGKVAGAGSWSPILDEQTHQGLVAFLSDPARRPGSAFERKHMLSGVALCGVCGGQLYAVYPQKRRTVVYACRPSSHVARVGPPLDAYVEAALLNYLRGTNIHVLLDDGNKVDIGKLQNERTGLHAQLDELADMYAEGTIDGSQLRRGTSKLRTKLARVDNLLAELAHTNPVAELLKDGPDMLQERWDALSPDLKGKAIQRVMTVTVQRAPRGIRWRLDTEDGVKQFGQYVDVQRKASG